MPYADSLAMIRTGGEYARTAIHVLSLVQPSDRDSMKRAFMQADTAGAHTALCDLILSGCHASLSQPVNIFPIVGVIPHQ